MPTGPDAPIRTMMAPVLIVALRASLWPKCNGADPTGNLPRLACQARPPAPSLAPPTLPCLACRALFSAINRPEPRTPAPKVTRSYKRLFLLSLLKREGRVNQGGWPTRPEMWKGQLRLTQYERSMQRQARASDSLGYPR
jgi:hypothetical protein